MLNWLSSNLSTILISIVLLAIVISIIRYLINQKKQGKSSCLSRFPLSFPDSAVFLSFSPLFCLICQYVFLPRPAYNDNKYVII